MAFSSDILFSIDTGFQQRGLVNVQTISDHATLDYTSSSVQIFTNSAGAPKSINLPAVKDGVHFWIQNTSSAAQPINVNGEGGATKATLAAGDSCLVVCDGTNWHLVIKA